MSHVRGFVLFIAHLYAIFRQVNMRSNELIVIDKIYTIYFEMFKVGFTGTREGITDSALKVLNAFLPTINIEEFHHGDCIGADAIVHNIIMSNNIPIIIHPPKDNKARAYCHSNTILPTKDYLQRNRDIVDCTDILIATPSTKEEILRSGTWSTIRYARKIGRPIIIFYNDGTWSN